MKIARKVNKAYANVFYIVDAYAFTSDATVFLVDILKGELHVDDVFDIVNEKGELYATYKVSAIEKDRQLVPVLVPGDCSRVLIEQSRGMYKDIMKFKSEGSIMYLVKK